MRTFKGLRKRKPLFVKAHIMRTTYRFVSAPGKWSGNGLFGHARWWAFSEVCRLCSLKLDAGCDFPPNLWAESPDLDPATSNGCESYRAHLNADFYSATPNIYLFVETLLRQQTSTYISLASLSQLRPVRKNSREKFAFLRRMYTAYRAGHVSRKKVL